MHVDQNGVMHPVTMRSHTEDGAQHYVVCVNCSARWAGPYTTRQGAAAVARTMNEDPEYYPARQLRTSLCCVEWVPDEDYRNGAVAFGHPVTDPVSPSQVVKVLETALIVVWFLASLARGLVLGALGAAGIVLPLVAVLLVAGGMSVVGISGIDLMIWLGVPVMLMIVSLVGWRWTRPRAEWPDKNYSTPLTTARGASNVVDVSRTPAGKRRTTP